MGAPSEGQQEPKEGEPSPDASGASADERLAAELRRRGVPEEEVARLLRLSAAAARPATWPAAPSTSVPSPAPPEPFTPHPTIDFPAFRETSEKEREEADRVLTSAHLARRRGDFAQAERLCRQALELSPGDAVALELYGDVLQAVGRVDDALAAYERATQADPARPGPGKKHAELLLLQDRSVEALRFEAVPRNPFVAMLLSTICPGAGQFYNGDAVKGLTLALIGLVCVLAVLWSPWGWSAGRGMNVPFTAVMLLVFAGDWIYAVVDAKRGAEERPSRSGWEV